VWADHDRLEQVFVNLFDNAVRHATGLSRVEVSATVDEARSAITVNVADDGPGISPELRQRVFLARERGTTVGPGAGLGLAIARGIVDAHGGSIALVPGTGGTTIAVSIPIEPEGAVPGEEDTLAKVAHGG